MEPFCIRTKEGETKRIFLARKCDAESLSDNAKLGQCITTFALFFRNCHSMLPIAPKKLQIPSELHAYVMPRLVAAGVSEPEQQQGRH